MSYTNSSLATYKRISPNKTSPRNHVIDTVTIHCYVGQVSVESMGSWFSQSTARASSNYGIGYDGRIGLFVEEKDRSWCSSSASNDNRAVTIEVASDKTDPYRVNDKAFSALLDLLVDICKRNGIKKLLWRGDKNLIGQVHLQNMTVHRWFANKACPGEYLYSRHSMIANEVNKRLVANEQPSVQPQPTPLKKEEPTVVRWKTFDDIPEGYYKQQAKRLIDLGVLKGKDNGVLDITEDMLRVLILCERLGNINYKSKEE